MVDIDYNKPKFSICAFDEWLRMRKIIEPEVHYPIWINELPQIRFMWRPTTSYHEDFLIAKSWVFASDDEFRKHFTTNQEFIIMYKYHVQLLIDPENKSPKYCHAVRYADTRNYKPTMNDAACKYDLEMRQKNGI